MHRKFFLDDLVNCLRKLVRSYFRTSYSLFIQLPEKDCAMDDTETIDLINKWHVKNKGVTKNYCSALLQEGSKNKD
jgi:hypothetical protein